MALLALQEPGARLTVSGGKLVVVRGEDVLRTVPTHEVDEVHLYGGADLTAAARGLLLRSGVDTLFFTATGRYQGRLVAAESPTGERRLAQYRTLTDPARALAFAARCVEGKLRNQRTLLRRAAADRQGDELAGALAALRRTIGQLGEAPDVETLRGLEGHGTAMYFRGLAAAVTNADLPFARRSRRPPRDPFNACLSFGYALLLTRVETAVRKAGLDPYVGALHTPGRGKPALVLDLMEELRPAVVDRLVLRLANRRQLAPGDFEHPDVDPSQIGAPEGDEEPEAPAAPAVYLARTGRAILLRAMARTWRTAVLVQSRGARFELGQVADQQAGLVARFVEGGDEYAPFLIR